MLKRLFLSLALALSASFQAGAQTNSPVPLKAEGIENFFKLSERVYSGAAPEGDAAFVALQKLGIKTVITVDGSTPNIELAHKYGMRYVHLPHGYNGINTNTEAQLVKAAESLPGPIYIHCHHGKHRGPTAAAIVCMATEGWSADRAETWLVTAGTATNYLGLFKTVRQFRPPSPDELKAIPSDFPETVRASGLVDSMVAIDERWDNLKAIRKAGYDAPKDNKDIDPANEAVILWEHFREAQRLQDSITRGEEFVEKLRTSETNAHNTEALFRQLKAGKSAEIRSQLDKNLDAIAQSCTSCHKATRDKALSQ